MRVKITEDEMMKFTKQFYKDPKFFPGFGEAFAPDVGEDTLKGLSRTLYERLSKVIPTKGLEEIHRCDFLTLALDSTYVRKIRDESSESASKLAADIIPKNCVVKKASEEVFKHFGFAKFEKGTKLADIVSRWEQNAGDSPKRWISELYAEMSRAICNAFTVPAWALLKSTHPDTDWWFYPVVNPVRIFYDDSMEFDIYLYRVPDNFVMEMSESKKSEKAT